MRYFKQGRHDGLCGFYAVLNAFRFLQHAAGHTYLRDDDGALFDDAVECLARVPGVDIRVLKSNAAIGGIDQFQIRDLCQILAQRIDLAVQIDLIGSRQAMPFRQRYRALWNQGKVFAAISAYRDGSHWTLATHHLPDAYRLIDEGRSRTMRLNDPEGPKLAADAAVIAQLL